MNDIHNAWWNERMNQDEGQASASGLLTLNVETKHSYSIFYIDDSFEKLLSLMVGSYYVTVHNNPSDVRKTRDMILGNQNLNQLRH